MRKEASRSANVKRYQIRHPGIDVNFNAVRTTPMRIPRS